MFLNWIVFLLLIHIILIILDNVRNINFIVNVMAFVVEIFKF
jgi:hypothetical protein